MSARNPRQIAAQHVDCDCGSHQEGAYPEAPVEVHAPPVRSGIGLTAVTAVSFGVVLVSGHLLSVCAADRCGAKLSHRNYVRAGCWAGDQICSERREVGCALGCGEERTKYRSRSFDSAEVRFAQDDRSLFQIRAQTYHVGAGPLDGGGLRSRRECPVVTEAEIDQGTAENGDAV
jgi:hypothetical protein